MAETRFETRHPELVSGSIHHREAKGAVAKWMLKQVQHDDAGKQNA